MKINRTTAALLFLAALAFILALAIWGLAPDGKVPLHGSSWKGEAPSFTDGADFGHGRSMKSPTDVAPGNGTKPR